MIRPSHQFGTAKARNGKRVEAGRSSQGAGQAPESISGLGVYIARRGIDFGTSMTLQSLEGIARLAIQQPLELLSLLPDIVPEIGLATWNGLRLGCSPGSVTIKAMTQTPDGGSEADPEGTADIEALFDQLPDEVGSFTDCLSRNYLSVLFSGMCCCEAAPGPRGTGIKEVWPVNPLTLRFKREDNGLLALYQRQTANTNGLGIYSTGFGGLFVPMPMERFFWSALDGFPDDPYGRAPFAPALNEVLRMLSFVNDLQLAFHRVGMPRFNIAYPFAEAAAYARDVMQLTDPKDIDLWVQNDFAAMRKSFSDLNADDAFFHAPEAEVNVTGSGKEMPDVSKIFDIIRYRLIIALKQNPVLMGFVNGSTETWSDVQWEIYSKGAQAIVQKAAQPLVRAAQLHLRLLGKPLKAVAEFEPIRSIQRLEDAQAEQVEIANEIEKVAQNWQLNATAAMEITGSDIPSPEEIAADQQPKVTTLPPAPPEPIKPAGEPNPRVYRQD